MRHIIKIAACAIVSGASYMAGCQLWESVLSKPCENIINKLKRRKTSKKQES